MSLQKDNKARGLVTLDSIVRGCLMDIGAGLERHEQFLHWAITSHKKLCMDIVPQSIKTVELPLTAWKSIEWPKDYLDWVMIGVRVNGIVRSFTNDENIALAFDDADSDGFPDVNTSIDNFTLDPTTDPTDPFVPEQLFFWGLTSRGEDAGQMYGLTVKGNGVGYIKINNERQEIQFAPTIAAGTTIYLEYLSSGYDPTKITMVHAYAEDAIRNYIHWMRLKFSKAPRVEVKMAMDDYYAELNRTITRMRPITVADVLEVIRDAYKLSPYF